MQTFKDCFISHLKKQKPNTSKINQVEEYNGKYRKWRVHTRLEYTLHLNVKHLRRVFFCCTARSCSNECNFPRNVCARQKFALCARATTQSIVCIAAFFVNFPFQNAFVERVAEINKSLSLREEKVTHKSHEMDHKNATAATLCVCAQHKRTNKQTNRR